MEKCQAIILQTRKLSDSSKIAIALTDRFGKISFVAKGAFKSKSKFAGSIQALNQLDIELSIKPNRELQTLTSAEFSSKLSNQFTMEPDLMAAAMIACELVSKTLPDYEENKNIFILLKNYLNALEDPIRAFSYLIRFEYKLLLELGFAINTEKDPISDSELLFSNDIGEVGSSGSNTSRIEGYLLKKFFQASKSKIKAVDLPSINNHEAKKITFFVVNYLRYHLDKAFKVHSLHLLEY